MMKSNMIDKLMFVFFLAISIVAVVIGVQNKAGLLIYGGVMYGLLTLYAGSKYMLHKLDNKKEADKHKF